MCCVIIRKMFKSTSNDDSSSWSLLFTNDITGGETGSASSFIARFGEPVDSKKRIPSLILAVFNWYASFKTLSGALNTLRWGKLREFWRGKISFCIESFYGRFRGQFERNWEWMDGEFNFYSFRGDFPCRNALNPPTIFFITVWQLFSGLELWFRPSHSHY